jgi:predicted RNA-binding Zn ribbon-like protein
MHTGHYVQVRYPHGGRWVTVAVSDTRTSAARVAANAYRGRHDPDGQAPCQVRIVSAAQLVREGGEQELRIADSELISGTTSDAP